MIRSSRLKLPDTRVILFNVAAGVVSIAALVALVRSIVIKPTAAPCSERYTSSTVFSLERGGALLTSTDLQARLGGRDVGLGDNVVIDRPEKGGPVAMGVTLAKGSSSPHMAEPAQPGGGMSFPWDPRALQGKTAACLAYSVKLPEGFDFGRGGSLPGIRGSDVSTDGDAFSAPLAWRRGGKGGATARVSLDGEVRTTIAEPAAFDLPTGSWVRLEQEVVLNTQGSSDGILRVWVDGHLAMERTDLTFRRKAGVTVSGVSADVYFGGAGSEANSAAPKQATIWLTPFDMRWP